MSGRGQIRGKIQRRFREEGLHFFKINGITHEVPIGTRFEEDIKRTRKGSDIVITYDETDSFSYFGL